jgi:hypothetical protein
VRRSISDRDELVVVETREEGNAARRCAHGHVRRASLHGEHCGALVGELGDPVARYADVEHGLELDLPRNGSDADRGIGGDGLVT